MSLALRTFAAMNLDVVVIAVSNRVRSPVAAAPRRSWSLRTCLRGHMSLFPAFTECYPDANLVTVTISVAIARSSAMARERRGQRRLEDKGVVEVAGGVADMPQSARSVDPVGERADPSPRRAAEPRSHDSSSPPDHPVPHPPACVLADACL
jgi:hypothetical protein